MGLSGGHAIMLSSGQCDHASSSPCCVTPEPSALCSTAAGCAVVMQRGPAIGHMNTSSPSASSATTSVTPMPPFLCSTAAGRASLLHSGPAIGHMNTSSPFASSATTSVTAMPASLCPTAAGRASLLHSGPAIGLMDLPGDALKHILAHLPPSTMRCVNKSILQLMIDVERATRSPRWYQLLWAPEAEQDVTLYSPVRLMIRDGYRHVCVSGAFTHAMHQLLLSMPRMEVLGLAVHFDAYAQALDSSLRHTLQASLGQTQESSRRQTSVSNLGQTLDATMDGFDSGIHDLVRALTELTHLRQLTITIWKCWNYIRWTRRLIVGIPTGLTNLSLVIHQESKAGISLEALAQILPSLTLLEAFSLDFKHGEPIGAAVLIKALQGAPRLTSLQLVGLFLDDSSVAMLADTLHPGWRSLVLRCSVSPMGRLTIAQNLPSTLQELWLEVTAYTWLSCSEQVFAHLADRIGPRLKILRLACGSEGLETVVERLPPSLEVLCLAGHVEGMRFFWSRLVALSVFCKQLRELSLGQLTNLHPDVLGKVLRNLPASVEVLDISGRKVGARVDFREFSQLTNLQKLEMGKMSGSIAPLLASLPTSLTFLDISDNAMDRKSFAMLIQRLPLLRFLTVFCYQRCAIPEVILRKWWRYE